MSGFRCKRAFCARIFPAEQGFILVIRNGAAWNDGDASSIVKCAIANAAQTRFTHRPDTDGTTASFCNQCFVTVAVARGEIELERAERAHVCDPHLLDYWKSLSDSNRFRKPDRE